MDNNKEQMVELKIRNNTNEMAEQIGWEAKVSGNANLSGENSQNNIKISPMHSYKNSLFIKPSENFTKGYLKITLYKKVKKLMKKK